MYHTDKIIYRCLQFGLKCRNSTDMCTTVLKESLAYYTADGGAAFCTFLDATKAFDHVNYCKLFSILLKRDIPVTLRWMALVCHSLIGACI